MTHHITSTVAAALTARLRQADAVAELVMRGCGANTADGEALSRCLISIIPVLF
jgi:hypothetical protein